MAERESEEEDRRMGRKATADSEADRKNTEYPRPSLLWASAKRERQRTGVVAAVIALCLRDLLLYLFECRHFVSSMHSNLPQSQPHCNGAMSGVDLSPHLRVLLYLYVEARPFASLADAHWSTTESSRETKCMPKSLLTRVAVEVGTGACCSLLRACLCMYMGVCMYIYIYI